MKIFESTASAALQSRCIIRTVISRLRNSRTRTNILPFVVLALTLRALLPMDWMASSGDVMVTSAMCSTTNALETLSVPGDGGMASHCDLCVLPAAALGVATATPQFIAAVVEPTTVASEVSGFGLLERAQSARGPPIFI